jgi:hypothetical protein
MPVRAAVRFACMASAACAAISSTAQGAQWLAVPQVTVGGDADTNRRLLRDEDARESESGRVAASLHLGRVTATDSIALVPRLTVSRYSGEDALDSDDWGANALWRHEGERLRLDFDAGVADDSTLITEPGETGLVEGNTRRRATSASAAVTHFLESRHMLQYSVSGVDIGYQRSAGTGLVNYRYPAASMLYLFNNSARLATTLGLSAARLDAPDARVRSDTRGAQLGLRFQASERCELEARAGSSETSARGRSDRDYSFHAGVTWNDEISSLELTASRDVEPSGRGVLVNADDLRLRYTRDLTERLALDTALRASRREDLDLGGGGGEYRYATAAATLSWKFEQAWTLSLAGVYSRQEYPSKELASVRDPAEGSRIGVALSWRPPQP